MRLPAVFLRITLAAFSIFALASAPAWADYDARRSEALDTLAKAKLAPEEDAALKSALDQYFRLRESCLKDLLVIVERDSASDLKQGEEWTKRAETCKSETMRPVTGAIQSLKDPSVGALGFATIFAVDENEFYTAVQKFSVATQRDRIVAINARIGEMTRILDEKWSSITSQDGSIDDRAKQTAAEINSLLKDAIDAAANRNTTAREKMSKVVEAAGKYEWPESGVPILDTLKDVIGVLQPFAETFNVMDTRVQERIQRLTSYAQGEAGLLIVFSDQRAVVAEFLRENGYPSAEEALRLAKASFNTLTGAVKTSAQKTDVDRFGNDALNLLNNHMNRAQSTYNTFVTHHQEKFFGPVSSKIEEELVELPFWDNWERAAFGLGLDAKLRDWQNDANNFFGVSTSGLEPHERDYIREQLSKDLDKLHAALELAKRDADARRVHDLLDRMQLIRIIKK